MSYAVAYAAHMWRMSYALIVYERNCFWTQLLPTTGYVCVEALQSTILMTSLISISQESCQTDLGRCSPLLREDIWCSVVLWAPSQWHPWFRLCASPSQWLCAGTWKSCFHIRFWLCASPWFVQVAADEIARGVYGAQGRKANGKRNACSTRLCRWASTPDVLACPFSSTSVCWNDIHL